MANYPKHVVDYTDDFVDLHRELDGGTLDFIAYPGAQTAITNQGKLRTFVFRIPDNNEPESCTALCVVTGQTELDEEIRTIFREGGLLRLERIKVVQESYDIFGGVDGCALRPVAGWLRRLGGGKGPEIRHVRWFDQPLMAAGLGVYAANGKVLSTHFVCLENEGGQPISRAEANARIKSLPDDYFAEWYADPPTANPDWPDALESLDGHQRAASLRGLLH